MKVGREIMSNVECWCGVAAGQALPSSMVSLLCSQWIGHVNSLIHFFPILPCSPLFFFSAHQRRRNKSEAPESCLLRPNQMCRSVWFRWFDSLVMVSSLVGLAAAYKTGSRQ